jgi:exostosin family protein
MPKLTFRAWQQLDLSLTEAVTKSGNFHRFSLSAVYTVRDSLPEGDRDLVLLIGRKNRADALRKIAEYEGRVVAVLSGGDHGVRVEDLPDGRELPANVTTLFAVNNHLDDRRAISLPLGVRVGNLSALQSIRQRPSRRAGLLYGNFTRIDAFYPLGPGGAPHIRARLVDRLSSASWASLDISDRSRTKREDLLNYYSETAAHRFVLAPEGNGPDSYRAWEALYLGAIPIVMRSRPMSAFAGLPILFTDDYSELSEDFLERRWQEMSCASFSVDRMLSSWYAQRFLEAVASLDDPDFVCLWTGDPASEVDRRLRKARAARGAPDS